jgi:hypothetical protein
VRWPTTNHFLLLCIPAFLWVAYRSYSLDITNDEAFSFYLLHHFNPKGLVGYANTHWPNSFCMLLQMKLLGTDIWKLRIHSVLSFALFSFFAVKIIRQINKGWLQWACLLLLIYNSYLLDFFSLARGYSMAIAFQMIAFYYITTDYALKEHRTKIYFWLSVSAFCLYTHLYILFAFMAYDLFMHVPFNKVNFTPWIKSFITPILLLLFAIPNLLFIKLNGDLNEGQTNGFIQDTLAVFIHRSWAEIINERTAFIISSMLFTLLIALLFQQYFNKQKNTGLLLGTLFLLVCIELHAFFYILGTPFPFARTSLFLFPLFVFSIIFLIDNNASLRKLSPLFFALSLFSIVYLVTFKNKRTTEEWSWNQGVSQAYYYIQNKEKANTKNTTLATAPQYFGVVQNYYQVINKITLKSVVRYQEHSQANYILLPKEYYLDNYNKVLSIQDLNAQLWERAIHPSQ